MSTTRTAIKLGDPLGIITLSALALPGAAIDDETVVQAIRRVYELAHGRFVETTIGAISIAPAVAPSLATAQFHAATRSELLAIIEEVLSSADSTRRETRSEHFAAGSALLEFLDGRLGAPDCWPNGCRSSPEPERIAVTAAR